MNYRKIWETHHGMQIPKGCEIHHVDGNRKNNSVENLLLVSIEEHLKIHRDQGDWGAVQAIMLRMENISSESLREMASAAQRKRYEEGKHNFQKISSERRTAISKKVHEKRSVAFLGIDDTVENSRKAGKASAKKKAGFLDVSAKHHGSKAVKGTYWWFNTITKKHKRAFECPGPEYIKGFRK